MSSQLVFADRVAGVPRGGVDRHAAIVVACEPLGLTLGGLLRPVGADDAAGLELDLPRPALFYHVVVPRHHNHSRSSSGSMPHRIDAASRKVISSYSGSVFDPRPWLLICACVRRWKSSISRASAISLKPSSTSRHCSGGVSSNVITSSRGSLPRCARSELPSRYS